MTYPSERLHEEVAYLSLHLHQDLGQVMQLDHLQRARWIEELSRLHRAQAEAGS